METTQKYFFAPPPPGVNNFNPVAPLHHGLYMYQLFCKMNIVVEGSISTLGAHILYIYRPCGLTFLELEA